MGGWSCAYYRRDKRARAPSVITAIRTEQTRNRHARENDSDAAYSIVSLLLDQGTPTFLYNQYLSKPRHTLSFRYPSPSAAAYILARGGSLCEACPNPVCRRGVLQPTDSDSGVTHTVSRPTTLLQDGRSFAECNLYSSYHRVQDLQLPRDQHPRARSIRVRSPSRPRFSPQFTRKLTRGCQCTNPAKTCPTTPAPDMGIS